MSETISIANLPTGTPSTDDILVFVDRTDGVTKRADVDELPASGTGDMLKSENLSGLADYAVARTNLGLQDLATLDTVGTAQIDNDAVTFAKVQNINTNRILGRSTAGTGDVEELNVTAIPALIGLGTSDSPQFAGVNIGHATDTTVTRVSAGVIAVEGIPAIIAGSTTVGQVPTITGTNTYSWQTPSSGGIGTTGFSVKLTSAQSITTTLSIVQFSNEEFDDGSNFNTGTYTYTAPSTGKYHIGYTIFIDSLLVNGDLVYVIMRKNGSTAMLYDYTRAGGAELSKISSRFFSLTAGDTIDIRIANSTASRGNINSTLSWFYGYKLP